MRITEFKALTFDVYGTLIDWESGMIAGLKPLTDQISEIWANLPHDLRARPVLISELIPQLRGRYNLRPSAGDVGQALRSLKFISVRDWRSGRRRWLPQPVPGTTGSTLVDG